MKHPISITIANEDLLQMCRTIKAAEELKAAVESALEVQHDRKLQSAYSEFCDRLETFHDANPVAEYYRVGV